eukprot:7378479-Prymnesium_polylepis.1
MACLDGLGAHHTFAVIKTAVDAGLDIALRFPHGSSRNQHEDFEHFSSFRQGHENAKIMQQTKQFQAARAQAALENRQPTRAELLAAAVLTSSTALCCAKQPWLDAFSEVRVQRGWREEGVVPFTRKLMWDLRKEEEELGIKVSAVPPVDLSPFNLRPLQPSATSHATALVPAPVGTALATAAPAWDEGIDAEVERLLRAEVGDPALNVSRVPPPPHMPKLTSALLFKLPGGATGETARRLVRAKEIERRLTAARAKYNQEKKKTKAQNQEENDFSVAADALGVIAADKYNLDKLNKPQLESLVRALKCGNGKANKPELKQQLTDKFGQISPEQFQSLRAAVQRGVAPATFTLVPDPPAPLEGPSAPPLAVAEVALTEGGAEQALALRRPRRG